MELDGQKLSLEQVSQVARGAEGVRLSAAARERMEASRRAVERIVAESRVVYGVNTGFGKLSDY
ncbi:MAG: aromatic amino acid lyase [Acidobacteria bacterium]|nr:aromatic amino acid lyase [Acidobacteriota bacterium]